MCGIYNSTQIYCVNTNTVPYDWYNQKVNDNKYLELENIRCFHHLNTFLGIPPSILILCTTKIKFNFKRACQNHSITLNQKKNILTSGSCIWNSNASTYRFLPQKSIFDSQSQDNKSDNFSLYLFSGSTAIIKINKVTVIIFMCFIHLYYLLLRVQQCCQDPKKPRFYIISLTRVKTGQK